ncbi:MAG: hypothetical protein JXJ17_18575 [Anaerolineae bacterium]|nr:hypothetical protein [Anaerolineae bacterium]
MSSQVFFYCASKKDQEHVSFLINKLKDDHKNWIKGVEIKCLQPPFEDIQFAEIVVVFLSNNSVNKKGDLSGKESKNFLNALNRRRKGSQFNLTVILVLLDECETPESLRDYMSECIDFSAQEETGERKLAEFIYKYMDHIEREPSRNNIGNSEELGNVILNQGSLEKRFGILVLSADSKRRSGQHQSALDDLRILRGIDDKIDFTQHIDLFINYVLMSGSIYDKTEMWDEYQSFEAVVLKPTLDRIQADVTLNTYSQQRLESVQGAYYTTMAVGGLRQLKFDLALACISNVLDYHSDDDNALNHYSNIEHGIVNGILYANALTIRAMINVSRQVYEGVPIRSLFAAEDDLETAGYLYYKHGNLGKGNEIHHAGRFWAANAFLRIALWKSGVHNIIRVDKLLEDSRRAHVGNERTYYGEIAGLYCDAYSQYILASILKMTDEEKRIYLMQSRDLLRSAREKTQDWASLATIKICRLYIKVSESLADLGEQIDTADFQDACSNALDSLRSKGCNFLDKINLEQWLEIPLN